MRAARPAAAAATVIVSLLVAARALASLGEQAAPAGAPTASVPLVVRSRHLELAVDPGTARVTVTDLRNGAVWSSIPDLPPDIRVVGLWQAHMRANFILEYAEADRRPKGMLNTSRYEPSFGVRPLDAGVAVDVQVTNPSGAVEFAFTMEFTLGDDYLDLRIPFGSLRERPGGLKLTSVAPLPFFGAATDHDQGYVFFPDGPGAISLFKGDHGSYQSGFREWVYQTDAWYHMGGGQVRLPVFGVKKGPAEAAFVGFITRGDTDAQIEYAPSGYVLPLYRVGPILVYRHRYSVALRHDAFVEKVDEELISGDRSVRYVFLSGPDASYSGMARAYRSYLVSTGGLRRAVPEGFSGYLDLGLFLGIEKPVVLWREFIAMTTFEQARAILEDLRWRGVDRLVLTLKGWQIHGYVGSPPERLPPDPHLGGTRGLEELVRYAREHGIEVWLWDQHLYATDGAKGYSVRTDAVRRPTREPVAFSRRLSMIPTLGETVEMYLMNPRAGHRIAVRDVAELKRLGVTGILDEFMAAALVVDYNPNAPMGRAEFAEWLLKLAEVYHEAGIRVGALKGNAYALSRLDRLAEMPLETDRRLFADETVPFFPMVVHGYVPYTSEVDGNLRPDPARMRLRNIEYGALPSYTLTHEPTSKMADVWMDTLFSTRYEEWVDTLVDEYREAIGELGYLQGIPMAEHGRIDEDVYQVRYEDASRVVVNYRSEAYRLSADSTLVVPAMGYLLIRPDGTTSTGGGDAT